jgi:hypothetical protein
MSDRIQARYWIETAYPLEVAASTMAGEQSTGTFVRVPGGKHRRGVQQGEFLGRHERVPCMKS